MSSDSVGRDSARQLPEPAGAPLRPKPPKNPLLALVLSFLFPGIGQVYNGQSAKAFVIFLAFAWSIYACIERPMPFAMLIPFVIFYNLIDAYRSAEIINSRHAGSVLEAEESGGESPAWGATLIALGSILLLNNLNLLPLERVHRFWPVALIVFGIVFLRSALQRRRAANDGHGPTR